MLCNRQISFGLAIITFAVSLGPIRAQEISVEPPPEELDGNKSKSTKGRNTKKLADDAYVMRHSNNSNMDSYKVLTLGDVLEQGLRQNYDQLIRNHQKKLLDLGFDDAYAKFWYPNIDLNLTTDTYRLGELFDGNDDGGRTTNAVNGNASITLGNYNLFNWGKDYLGYQNDRNTYRRSITQLQEFRRNLKQNLIISFFELLAQKKIERAYREKLRYSAFVYRYNKERFAKGKTNRLQFLQARNEFLKSQSEYQDVKIQSEQTDEKIAYLIADNVGTRYILKEDVRFEKIKLNEDQAYKLSEVNNPAVLNAKTDVQNSTRELEIQKRENLPLPKLTVNLGAYNHNFNSAGQRTIYETEDNSSNIELVATLTATWSILGEGGLFNHRKTTQALVAKNQNLQKLLKNKRQATSNIRALYRATIRYEKQIEILSRRVSNAEKLAEGALTAYTESKARFPDFKTAVEDYTTAQVDYARAQYNHVRSKILIAQNIGIEELPGEVFEKLAILEKDKE
jgi:outer membrane protein TolC